MNTDERHMQSISFNIGDAPTELHGISGKSKNITLTDKVAGQGGRTIDANMWLPRAAEHYHISPKLSDYVLVPVPSIISELSNTNGDSVTKEELLRFHPEHGQLAYQTWKGKPTHVEHDNKDITKAKGVILDVFLRKLTGFAGNHVKVIKLLAFDRTKDERLTTAILNREINTYSLGMWFKSYTCTICNNRVGQNFGQMCSHTRPRMPVKRLINGQLAYRQCENIVGFETSAVEDPAYVVANSDIVMDVRQLNAT